MDRNNAREDDGIDAQVSIRAVPGLLSAGSPLRRTAESTDPLGGAEVDAGVRAVLQRRRGGGEPLPGDLAGTLGAHFGQDISGVRVHTDGESGRIARSLQSTAFTHGSDVYFAPGAYQPGSDRGKRVIAHELGHVVAQRTGTDRPGGGRLTVGRADDPAEQAADRAADGAMAALRRSTERGAQDVEPGPADEGAGQVRRLAVPEVLRRKVGLLSKLKKKQKNQLAFLEDADNDVVEDDENDVVGDAENDAKKPVVKASGFGLSREAREGFTAAKQLNGRYADFETMTAAWVTQDQQKKIADVGGRSKGPAKTDKRTVKELMRAFLMAKYVQVLDKHIAKSRTDAGEWAEPTPDERASFKSRYFPKTLQNRDKYKGLIKKGPYAPETVTWLYDAGFGRVVTKSEEELADEAGGPKIDVRSTFIGGTVLGMRHRMHLFIVYTESGGDQMYLRGGPGQDGNTRAVVAQYEPGTVDWDPSAPSVTVLTGEAAKSKLDGMIEATLQVNALRVPYSGRDVKLNKGGLGGLEAIVSGENCNSVAWTILKRAGVPTKKPSGLHPGWGHVLGDLKGQGAQPMPGKERTYGRAAVIKGKSTDSVEVHADRAGREELAQLSGGTPVEHISIPSFNGLVKIKFGPDGTFGWVDRNMVGDPPKPRKAGRRFWVKGKPNEMIPMFDEHNQPTHADGQNPIEVLDDDFVIGKGGAVAVRYSDKYVGEIEGTIDAKHLTDQDPKVAPKDEEPKPIPQKSDEQVQAESRGDAQGERHEGLEQVTFPGPFPLYNEDGTRHEYKGVSRSGCKVNPTGRTVKAGDKQMVEFEVVEPHVIAWMPARDWQCLTGKKYPA